LFVLLLPPNAAVEALLFTVAEAEKWLVLLVLPDVAPPLVVLWYTPASPDSARWKLPFLASKSFQLWTYVLPVFVELTVLVEFGPVPLTDPVVCAAAIPVVRLSPRTVAAVARRSFFMLPPYLLLLLNPRLARPASEM
jgi:hypothetical protein